MPRILKFELTSVDLPFRHPFRHAAASRTASGSLFLKCVTDSGAVGFGESLPREYVTGETRDGAFQLLHDFILPSLIGREFGSMHEVRDFLESCDGKAPIDCLDSNVSQTAAWCAVDLALLDAFGHTFHEAVQLNGPPNRSPGLRYSGIVSADGAWRSAASLVKLKLCGFKHLKLKTKGRNLLECARLARRLFRNEDALRVDVNMGWNFSEALEHIRVLEQIGIHCVEQPLDSHDLEGLSRLTHETQSEIIADEAFHDRASLDRLIRRPACHGVNIRISKCGGLIASARRYREAQAAGLTLQIGCQVGESSLLSAAQLVLIGGSTPPKYLEGCYGRHLLREDPAHPCLQLGYGGRLPPLPGGPGLGVRIDEAMLNRWATNRVIVEECIPAQTKGVKHVTHSQTCSGTHGVGRAQSI